MVRQHPDSTARRAIPVKLGPREIALIDAAAEGLELARSTFMRQAAVRAAARTLVDGQDDSSVTKTAGNR